MPVYGKKLVTAVLVLLPLPFLVGSVWAQGLLQSPYSAPSVVRGGLDLAPSNPLGMPGSTGGLPRGSDSIPISPQLFQGILPQVPNLQVGYLYSFGNSVRSGRLTLDYLLPITLGSGNSVVFGEAHTELQDFWKTVQGSVNNRVDISIGGGIRKIFAKSTLVGVNGFFDGTRLGGTWYNSGSVGLEYAAILPGNDAIDLSFNWYGNLFNSNVLANAFRNGPANYDIQAGYAHELWEGGPDLRLYASGYKFSAGSGVYGARGGAELKTRDGMFVLKYEAAHDIINNTYYTVGGFVNVGLQLGNLLNGESPFVMPEPIFKSPRNIRKLLEQKVNRSWHQGAPPSATATAAAQSDKCPRGTTVWNISVSAPATMSGGASVCYDFTTITFFVTELVDRLVTRSAGTKGNLRIILYHFGTCATQYLVEDALIDGIDESLECDNALWIGSGATIRSVRVQCMSAGGCDAGTISYVKTQHP